uniref:Ig-like domain-containing protein n=1 Tax=Xenopus tropicalis TaxID=8364 RepID=L7N3E5_XENTR
HQTYINIYFLPTGMNCQREHLPGFSIEAPAGVRVQRGLCVRIPCNFTVGPGYTLTRDAIGIWYKGEKNPPVAASTNSSQFPDTTNGRFIFTGKVSAGDCSFSISDAQPGDTDRYQFRVEDKGSLKMTYIDIQPSVSVTEPDISPTEGLIAGEEVTLTCTAPTNCPGLSPTFTWEGSVNTERTQNHTLRHQDGNFSYWSDITFTPSPRDHNSPLSCTVTYKHGSTSTSITLNVNCESSFHYIDQGRATYGPRATSSPLVFLIWPANSAILYNVLGVSVPTASYCIMCLGCQFPQPLTVLCAWVSVPMTILCTLYLGCQYPQPFTV